VAQKLKNKLECLFGSGPNSIHLLRQLAAQRTEKSQFIEHIKTLRKHAKHTRRKERQKYNKMQLTMRFSHPES